jgi:hypothetical protein
MYSTLAHIHTWRERRKDEGRRKGGQGKDGGGGGGGGGGGARDREKDLSPPPSFFSSFFYRRAVGMRGSSLLLVEGGGDPLTPRIIRRGAVFSGDDCRGMYKGDREGGRGREGKGSAQMTAVFVFFFAV